MATVTVGIPDPATCAINPDAGGGGGGNFLPIADQSPGFNTVTQPNTVSGIGDIEVLSFPPPGDTTGLAFQKDGDDFPTLLLGVDPNDYAIAFGDGSFDAYNTFNAVLFYDSGLVLFSAVGIHLRGPVDFDSLLVVPSLEVTGNDGIEVDNGAVAITLSGQPAVILTGNGGSFPGISIFADAGFGLNLGDGTDDPLNIGAYVRLLSDGSLGLAGATASNSPVSLVGDLIFNTADTGPVIPDQSDGHTYRIISTAGILSTEQVT